MMSAFEGICIFALWMFVVTLTPRQLWAQKGGSRDDKAEGPFDGEDSSFESGFLCSEAGNCTRQGKVNVTVKCHSAGDRLDEIVSDFPQTTTLM